MADILSALQQQQQRSAQQAESLSERLERMDAFQGAVDPQIRAQSLDFSGRPTLANPLDSIAGQLDLGERARTQRSNIADDLARAEATNLDALSKIDTVSSRGGGSSNPFSELEQLLGLRAKLNDAGVDTSTIDQQLTNMGFAPVKQEEQNPFTQGKLSDLNSTEGKQLAELATATKRLQDLQSGINKVGARDTGDVGSFGTAVTGPLATILPQGIISSDVKDFQSQLDTFQDEVRKERFGSAFTESERKVANLPGSGKQEARNRRIINDLSKAKLNEFETRLQTLGLSQPEIDQALSFYGIDRDLVSGNSGTNSLNVDGYQIEIVE